MTGIEDKILAHLAPNNRSSWTVRTSQWLLLTTIALLISILLIGMMQTQPKDVLQEIQSIKEQINNEVKPSDVLKKVEEIELRLDVIQEYLLREGMPSDEKISS